MKGCVKVLCGTALLSVFLSVAASAQTTRGGRPGPAVSNPDLPALINELNKQLDRGERRRLADPSYLGDLRAIVRKYDNPWRRQILYNDFYGQGPQPPAPWRVVAGEFRIDHRYGLRSVAAAVSAPAPSSRQSNGGDIATALFGAILEEALTSNERQGSQETATAPESRSGYAAITAPVAIPNAFAIDIQFTSRPVSGSKGGRLEIGTYPGAEANSGYRVVYDGNASPGAATLALTYLSARGGTATLDLYRKPLALEDNRIHALRWTRDRNGTMHVTIDGQGLIQVTDRSLYQAFDGLIISNRGGDYAIRQLQITGAD
ncbi:MAG: hypothetical protein ACE5GZ_04385 [Gammaproteobacteria bacterium]